VAAGAIVEDGAWLGRLQGELRGLLAWVFAQARSQLTAFAYIGALLAEPGERRSCWQLAEQAGHATPRRMQALLAVAAHRAPLAGSPSHNSGAGQPAAWRDTGKLPAGAGDQPPGGDPGLVKVSVPEARRLACLATAPMSRAARDLGYAWSRWRRRHQARARWHHYHARLKAARVTLSRNGTYEVGRESPGA